MRRLLCALAFLLALAASAHSATLGKPIAMLWDYSTALGSGVTADSFIVQGCQAIPDCNVSCTPIDLYSVTPVVIGTDVAFADINVAPGNSYRYQILTLGTVSGVSTRSAASNQACLYVKAKKRGSPSPFPSSLR